MHDRHGALRLEQEHGNGSQQRQHGGNPHKDDDKPFDDLAGAVIFDDQLFVDLHQLFGDLVALTGRIGFRFGKLRTEQI